MGRTVFFFARSPEAPQTTIVTSFFNSIALHTLVSIPGDVLGMVGKREWGNGGSTPRGGEDDQLQALRT
jgi:hypothetical protein